MNSMVAKGRHHLNELLQLDSLGVAPGKVRVAINRSQMTYLPFTYAAVAFFFIGYAILQGALLREDGAALMIVVALASAGVMFGGAWALRQRFFASQLAEPLVAFGAALVLVSIVLRAQLTGDPRQAANFALFLFAIAIIFVSSTWYAIFAALTLAALVWAMVTFPGTPDWPYYLVVTLAAMATGFMAHIVRARSYRRAVILRIVEKEQREVLQQRTLQLETAVAVGHHVTSILDLDTLLADLADLIREKYDVYYVGVLIPSTNGLHLRLAAAAVRDQGERVPGPEISMRGFPGWVLQHGRSLRLDNVLQDARFDPQEVLSRTQSELVLPLQMGDECLGVLDLQSDHSRSFAPDEVDAYQLLADQVAIALKNAQHYEALRQLNQDLESKVQERTWALQDAYGRLERLDATKADFITIASHELRTPLTIVNFNSQMFLEDETILENGLYRGWAEGVQRGVVRMEAVVENILDVAKIDSRTLDLYPSPLSLRFLIQQVISRLKPALAERALEIVVSDMPGLPEIDADAEAMEKLFYQLLVNAIKFTPDGGTIRVAGRHQQSVDSRGMSQAAVEILLSDTGIGVDPEVHDLIFEKFFQLGSVALHSSGNTTFRGGGSGIGLAIAKGIVEAHNGRIWVESDAHNEETCPGSVFHIVLPIHQPNLAMNGDLSRVAGQVP